MPAMPKRIDFDDIKVGDIIRVVDVRDFTVSAAGFGEEVRDEHGNGILRSAPNFMAARKFQLVERPLLNLPIKLGSTIKVNGATQPWTLFYDIVKGRKAWISINNGLRITQAAMQVRVTVAGGFEVLG